MTRKKGMIKINGKWIDLCEYKNCREMTLDGYICCKKHIGQNKRDFNKNHITMNGMVFKCDKQLAKIFNK